MQTVEQLLLAIALLLLLSVLGSKASGRLGVPALLVFLALGMLAGSEGIGGIEFDDARIAQWLGVVTLAFILFAGGLETEWHFVRRSVWPAVSLSTIGVVVTAGIVAVFAFRFLHLTLAEGFLLGAIVSATDAAAVFSILRAAGVRLNNDVTATLELESGSNDPTAVFLTIACVQVLTHGDTTPALLVLHFVREMSFGAICGIGAGFGGVWLLNRLRLEFEGLYPVLTIAVVMLTYSVTDLGGGNGFLAVYLAGIVMGNRNFIQRRRLTRFHDGLAWLLQIAMFLTLGLLVFPSRLVTVASISVALTAVLMFVARPVAVFLSLAFSKMSARERTVIAWVGLRGAVPIVLATFPLLAGVPNSGMIFNIVFFVVLASVAVQGTTVAPVARWLHADVPRSPDHSQTVASLPPRSESSLVTLAVGSDSPVAGRRVVELGGWPRDALILVLYRGEDFFLPHGATELRPGDRLIVLANRTTIERLHAIVDPAPSVE